ncbi:19044_t:CDS:1, partial [Gigaspora rosea]
KSKIIPERRARDSRNLGEYKNRTLKKNNTIAEYLGIQHVELVCVIRETIEIYDYIQHKM